MLSIPHRVKRKPAPTWDDALSSNRAQTLMPFHTRLSTATSDTSASEDSELETRPHWRPSARHRPQTAPMKKMSWSGTSSTDVSTSPTSMTDAASSIATSAELRTPPEMYRQLPVDLPITPILVERPSTAPSDVYRHLTVDPPCTEFGAQKAPMARMPSSLSSSSSFIKDFSSPRHSPQISPSSYKPPKTAPSVLRKSNSTRSSLKPKSVAFTVPAYTPTDEVGVLEKAATPADVTAFDTHSLPTPAQLQHASSLFVIAENGIRVPFGALWNNRKTIVIFLRHFMCPLCQDYMASISRSLAPSVLYDNNVQMVFIGNGAHELISYYRAIFNTPFQMYTDPTHAVYEALGMDRKTLEPGPQGSYVRHGLLGGIGMVVRNALRVRMPIYKKKGDIAQLGGEFVLGPGLDCTLAHRMEFTQSHMPILDVVRAAGIDMQAEVEVIHDHESDYARRKQAKEAAWVDDRIHELLRIQHKRMSRRCGSIACDLPEAVEEIGDLDDVLDISLAHKEESYEDAYGGYEEDTQDSFWDGTSNSPSSVEVKE